MSTEATQLEPADFVVIALHFVVTVGVGLWAAFKDSRSSSKNYFLAGRDMSWWLVGMSLYVSNIGSSSFIGVAGAASSTGIAVITYELTGLFCIQLLGFVFVPVYIASRVYTMPEYTKKRFKSNRCQIFLAVYSLILFVFTKLSSEVYAGALIIQLTLGWDKYLSVLLLLATTAIYTILGGLAAVIYTDALQTIVILIGATILTIMGFIRIGGYESMASKFMDAAPSILPNSTVAGNTTCGLPPDDAFHIIRDASRSDYPWPGVTMGVTILSAWYFCTDQVLVQRLLAAKNTIHAKGGSILAGYFKILPLFLMVYPGMISRALFPDTVGCADPEVCFKACGNRAGCSDSAYVKLVLELMPQGLRGLMLAAMLAALMSSLTSIFNSGSTVFTMDIWKKIRKQASETELMIVGRVFVLVFTGVAIAWLPMVGTGGKLFDYIQSITSYTTPPVLAVYLMGVCWKRTTEPAAFWGLVTGLVVGSARMIVDWALGSPVCGQKEYRPDFIANFHYLHYAIFVFVLCLIVVAVISILTKPLPEEQILRLTWGTRNVPDYGDEIKDTFGQQDGMVEIELVAKPLSDSEGDDVTIEPRTNEPRWKKLLKIMCGISSQTATSAAELAEQDRIAANRAMKEDPKKSFFIYVNLVILFCIGSFVFGFLA